MKITKAMQRWARRHIWVNDTGNLVVRVEDGAPIELLYQALCPRCRTQMGDCVCGWANNLTLVELVKLNLARRVEQV